MDQIRIPKRIAADLMRARLGDKETERILSKLFTPFAEVKLDPKLYQVTLNQLDRPTKGSGQMFPRVFRQFFTTHPRYNNALKKWLNEQIMLSAPVEVAAPRRRRRNRRKAA